VFCVYCVLIVFFLLIVYSMCSFSTLILLVGFLTCKNCRPYNLYYVGGDVKPCSISQPIKAVLHHASFEMAKKIRGHILESSWENLRKILTLGQSLTISGKTLTRHKFSLPTNSRFNNNAT